MVTGASSGPATSACSGTPSSASTVSGRPRSWPSGSSAAGSGRSRSRPTAIFSAAITAPTPAAAAPTARPPALVSRSHLLIGPPVDGEHAANPILPGCYPGVAPRNLAGEPGHDLVGQGAEGVGPLLRGGLARVAGPEQDHLVVGLGGQVADVDHHVVHVDGAGDGEPPAAHLHLRGAGGEPGHALVVAERDHAQGGRAPGDVAGPVGHPRTAGHPLGL